ncbi:hypothetical protein JCM10213_002666 [Rhodosporidiobolus nylandii]
MPKWLDSEKDRLWTEVQRQLHTDPKTGIYDEDDFAIPKKDIDWKRVQRRSTQEHSLKAIEAKYKEMAAAVEDAPEREKIKDDIRASMLRDGLPDVSDKQLLDPNRAWTTIEDALVRKTPCKLLKGKPKLSKKGNPVREWAKTKKALGHLRSTAYIRRRFAQLQCADSGRDFLGVDRSKSEDGDEYQPVDLPFQLPAPREAKSFSAAASSQPTISNAGASSSRSTYAGNPAPPSSTPTPPTSASHPHPVLPQPCAIHKPSDVILSARVAKESLTLIDWLAASHPARPDLIELAKDFKAAQREAEERVETATGGRRRS